MRKVVLIYLFSGFFLVSCSLKELDPNHDAKALYQRFHGKYEVVSSTSSEPIDVNLDGKSSVDMIQEYPYLKQYNLELRIYRPEEYKPGRGFSFVQWWPEQYIQTFANEVSIGQDWTGQLVDYVPNRSVDYAQQGSPRTFEFSADLKQLLVAQNKNENPFRWQRPESTTVDALDHITTVNKRRIYTRAGVKEVSITTVYKRYTMIT